MNSTSSTTRSCSAPFTSTATPERKNNTRARELFPPIAGDRVPLLRISSPIIEGTPENGTGLFMASLPEASRCATPPPPIGQHLNFFPSPERTPTSNKSTPPRSTTSKHSTTSIAARHPKPPMESYILNKIVVASFEKELEKMFYINEEQQISFTHRIIDCYAIPFLNLSLQENLNPLIKEQGDNATLTLLNIFMVLNFEKIAKTTAFKKDLLDKVDMKADRLWDIFSSLFNENMQELKSIAILHSTSINCSDVKRERGQLCGTLLITVSGVAGGLLGGATLGPIGTAIGSGLGMFGYTAASLGSRKHENIKENKKNTLELERLIKIVNHVELPLNTHSLNSLRVPFFESDDESNSIFGIKYNPAESILS